MKLCRLFGAALFVLAFEGAAFASSSVDFAKSLGTGWNLGNTLDAFVDDEKASESTQGLNSETSWGMPKTTKPMIDFVREAGFKTVRIPVTWHNHIIDEKNYTIDSEWMDRVREIVDYAYDEGMYVIINVHHDTINKDIYGKSASNGRKIVGYVLDEKYEEQSKAYLSAVWKQIAAAFKEYDEHLIFEVLNEPRAVGTPDEWYVADSKKASRYCSLITEYEETCIQTIRNSGGNNRTRYLMFPCYAGSNSLIHYFTVPQDPAVDRLLFSVHAYSPYPFAMYDSSHKDKSFDKSDESDLYYLFEDINDVFIKKGIGTVIGETSAENKNNLKDREKWASYFFGTARKNYSMPAILWDNNVSTPDTDSSGEHHGYLDRNRLTWYFPTIIKAALGQPLK